MMRQHIFLSIAIIFGLVIVGLFCRFSNLSNNGVVDTDEASYYLAAKTVTLITPFFYKNRVDILREKGKEEIYDLFKNNDVFAIANPTFFGKPFYLFFIPFLIAIWDNFLVFIIFNSIISVITGLIIYDFLQKRFGVLAGVFSSLLVLLSPYLIFLSQSAYSSTLSLFFFTLGLVIYLGIYKYGILRLLLVGICLGFSICNHYSSIPFILVFLVTLSSFSLLINKGHFANTIREFIIISAGIIGVVVFFELFYRFIGLFLPRNIQDIFKDYFNYPWFSPFQQVQAIYLRMSHVLNTTYIPFFVRIKWYLSVLIYDYLFILPFFVLAFFSKEAIKQRIVMLCLIFIVASFVFLGSLRNFHFQTKTIIYTYPPIAICLGIALSSLRLKRTGKYILSILFICCLVLNLYPYIFNKYFTCRPSPFKKAAEFIRENGENETLIMILGAVGFHGAHMVSIYGLKAAYPAIDKDKKLIFVQQDFPFKKYRNFKDFKFLIVHDLFKPGSVPPWQKQFIIENFDLEYLVRYNYFKAPYFFQKKRLRSLINFKKINDDLYGGRKPSLIDLNPQDDDGSHNLYILRQK